jgi:exopolyphosphatase/guanosine-5'-triphosphate,3'-diphosphate pyrophosphatase
VRAVIDIGTNTLLLLIVDDRMQRVIDLCRFGRLGRALDATGELAAEAIAASLAICREYRRVLDDHGVVAPAILATQALREARNAAAFVAPAERILGAPIEIITGAREAELAHLAVARTFPDLARAPHIVVDVGGGSTEIIASDGTRITSATSVPIGAVRLHERCGDDRAALAAQIDAALDRHVGHDALPCGVPIIGTAGTATTIAGIALALATFDPDAVTGVFVTPPELAAIAERLLTASVAQRRAIPGVEPARADVVAAGVAIYARLVERLAASVLVTSDRGIRWGRAYELATG